MPWKTRLLLALLAFGTVAGYGSAIARFRHHAHGGACACQHAPVDPPPATP